MPAIKLIGRMAFAVALLIAGPTLAAETKGGTVSLPSQEDLLDVPAFLRRQAD